LAGTDELCMLLAAVKKLGGKAELQTNALAAADMPAADLSRIVRALAAADGYFNVNFPAAAGASDYRITRAKDGFRRRFSGVRRLIAAGARVRLTCVISSLNYRGLPAYAGFLAKELKDAAWVQFSFVKGIGRAGGGRFVPRYSEVQPFLEQAIAALQKAGLRCDVDHIPPCRLGRFAELNVDIGKMRSGRPGPHLQEKARVPECRGCRFLKVCPGPRKDYIEVHGAI